MPAVIAATPASSRRPTGSSSMREPIASRTIRLVASAGSTRVSGMRSRAATWTAQPQRASDVPRSQRGFVASRRRSERRRCWSAGAARASRACSPTAVAYKIAVVNASARPPTTSMTRLHDSLAVAGHLLPAPAVGVPWLRRVLRIRDRVDDRAAVGLTFDDGPHPEGTPAVMEGLAAAGAHATFFLVGEQVERRRGLAAEIVASGHRVALHCYRHRNFLALTPGQARDDLLRAAAVIEDATGVAPTQFRPPFGYLTAAALAIARARGWEVVLWRRIGYDWRPAATPESIARRATRRLRGGEIIVLHDADFYSVPGAWRKTAAALPLLFERLHERGLVATSL
jgi:peptidoglycan/xylan/chitin deacetylase (PgdA/CDA1 family)